jgi:beta-glucosidase
VTPNFQLCGLKAVELAPGESRRVEFDIPKYWVSAVLEDGTRTAPDGELAFYLGGSQPDERSLELTGKAARKVVIR